LRTAPTDWPTRSRSSRSSSRFSSARSTYCSALAEFLEVLVGPLDVLLGPLSLVARRLDGRLVELLAQFRPALAFLGQPLPALFVRLGQSLAAVAQPLQFGVGVVDLAQQGLDPLQPVDLLADRLASLLQFLDPFPAGLRSLARPGGFLAVPCRAFLEFPGLLPAAVDLGGLLLERRLALLDQLRRGLAVRPPAFDGRLDLDEPFCPLLACLESLALRSGRFEGALGVRERLAVLLDRLDAWRSVDVLPALGTPPRVEQPLGLPDGFASVLEVGLEARRPLSGLGEVVGHRLPERLGVPEPDRGVLELRPESLDLLVDLRKLRPLLRQRRPALLDLGREALGLFPSFLCPRLEVVGRLAVVLGRVRVVGRGDALALALLAEPLVGLAQVRQPVVDRRRVDRLRLLRREVRRREGVLEVRGQRLPALARLGDLVGQVLAFALCLRDAVGEVVDLRLEVVEFRPAALVLL